MPSSKPSDSKHSRQPFGQYPRVRMRRNRSDDWVRRLTAENTLTPADFIWPVFVKEGSSGTEPVPSLPGVDRMSVPALVKAAEKAAKLGIPMLSLFPFVPKARKTDDAREAWRKDNVIGKAIRALKKAVPEIGIMSDVALDPYISHGQDGLERGGRILNDETIEVLIKQSLALAEAGVDVVGPSDMMDGRVGRIRDALDANGYSHVKIMAYSAKYASNFYGPFREAVGSKSALGKADKRTYQIDPANGDEALRDTALDVAEGADMLMVKPGLPYLDILWRVKQQFKLPTFAYQVSGEYAMIKAAAQNGWLDNDKVVLETLMCFKRAGADGILTYSAIEACALLKRG